MSKYYYHPVLQNEKTRHRKIKLSAQVYPHVNGRARNSDSGSPEPMFVTTILYCFKAGGSLKPSGPGFPNTASLVAQTVKNLPAMWVRSMGWEDPLEKGMATHSCLECPVDRGARWATMHGVAKSQT